MEYALQSMHTTEDIYALPEGERAELIDGQMFMMAPPSRWHQYISMELSAAIHEYIRQKGGQCKVYAAPFAVFLNADNKNYVEPDISVICDQSKLTDRGCEGAPDWVIEIVSPGSERMDYMIKLLKYNTAGVREYWIVDQRKNRIMVYDFGNDAMSEYSFSDKVKVGIYEDLEIDFSLLAQ